MAVDGAAGSGDGFFRLHIVQVLIKGVPQVRIYVIKAPRFLSGILKKLFLRK